MGASHGYWQRGKEIRNSKCKWKMNTKKVGTYWFLIWTMWKVFPPLSLWDSPKRPEADEVSICT